MKRISYILLIIVLTVFGCIRKDNNTVQVHGEIVNLGICTMHVNYVNQRNEYTYDKISSNKNGQFDLKVNTIGDISPITIYFVENKSWTTLFANPGDKISIVGDMNYVDLLTIKGGVVNNDLDRFKSIIKTIYKERIDILNKKSNPENNVQIRLREINQLLKRAAKDFILKNPETIASVVLIQDFFYQDYDTDTPELLSSLKGVAFNSKMANKMRIGVKNWDL